MTTNHSVSGRQSSTQQLGDYVNDLFVELGEPEHFLLHLISTVLNNTLHFLVHQLDTPQRRIFETPNLTFNQQLKRNLHNKI
jgi:hypothetical protein